jgi:hypothetical protein
MMKEEILKEKMMGALSAALKSVPFFTVRGVRRTPVTAGAAQADIVVRVGTAKGKEKLLLIECKNNGQPRLVREAINQLRVLRADYPDAYGIVAAPYISSAAAELCSRDGIGYVDLAGNCRLSFDSVHVLKEGAKNPFTEKRDLRSLYSPRAARILRVLLNDPQRAWKIQLLARDAKTSVGQVANVKKLLKDREWIRINDNGFFLSAPAELIREWSQNYSFRKNQLREFYSMSDLPAIESKLADYVPGIKYPML